MKKLLLFLLSFSFLVSGFASNDTKTVSEGNSLLAIKLMQSALHKEGQRKNVLISPLSVYTAFTMLANGSEPVQSNQTYLELNNFLGVSSQKELNRGLRKIIADLTTQGVVDFQLANAIYSNTDNFIPNIIYITKLDRFYDADVRFRSFTPAKRLVNEINSWVSAKTKQKITSVFKEDDVTKDSVFFLLNALYMKGDWLAAFNDRYTSKDNFHLANGNKISHDFMNLGFEGKYLKYARTENAQIVSLPLGKFKPKTNKEYENNKRFLVDFILPDQAAKKDAILAELKGDYVKKMKCKKTNVILPKFEIGYTMELDKVLQQEPFYMKEIFDPFNANLKQIGKGISGENIYVAMARHKTYAKVDEKGFEGAAVTVIGGARTTSLPTGAEITLKFDRPFFFVVRDAFNHDLPIFLGGVVNPAEK